MLWCREIFTSSNDLPLVSFSLLLLAVITHRCRCVGELGARTRRIANKLVQTNMQEERTRRACVQELGGTLILRVCTTQRRRHRPKRLSDSSLKLANPEQAHHTCPSHPARPNPLDIETPARMQRVLGLALVGWLEAISGLQVHGGNGDTGNSQSSAPRLPPAACCVQTHLPHPPRNECVRGGGGLGLGVLVILLSILEGVSVAAY